MSAIFDMPIDSEILSQDEIAGITGCHRKADQIHWLELNGWQYHTNKAGEPIVGRLYARLKLAGINPPTLTTSGGWVPDFSKVQ
jgi:hypothetical protein